MLDATEERVSENFNLDKLLLAQSKTWELIEQLSQEIKPGMREADALEIYKKLQVDSGAEKYWHPPKIRFGKNTLNSFRQVSDPDVVLKENDIYFLDVGPIYDGYEGDAGRTFTLGDYAIGERVIAAGLSINQALRSAFAEKNSATSASMSGAELYNYASRLAKDAGYELVGEGANGHRIGDFPHAAYYRGNLNKLERNPAPHRWILEVQIRDIPNQIGSFFEDILG